MTQRDYRHDLRCPHCGSNWMPKYGTSRGKQTYLRLLARLPETAKYSADRYEVYNYNWLPPDRHVARKGRKSNRNEGLHSVWRGS